MTATFASEHVAADDLRLVRQADMRYQGQEHTVTVPIPDGPLDDNMAEVRAASTTRTSASTRSGSTCPPSW